MRYRKMSGLIYAMIQKITQRNEWRRNGQNWYTAPEQR